MPAVLLDSLLVQKFLFERRYDVSGHADEHLTSATAVFPAFALVVIVFTALLRVPVLNVISGALFVIPMLVALLGSILALTVIAGFPLMPAAIAVEDCDAGDAITRAGALVLARPLAWLGILGASLIALAIGGILVNAIVATASTGIDTLLATLGGDAGRALGSGAGAEVAALFGPDRLVAILVGFWNSLLDATVAATAPMRNPSAATRDTS